jgi:hypothetical protein
MNREHEHAWMMMAAATLAGGGNAKAAVANADQVLDALKSRFAKKDDEDGD